MKRVETGEAPMLKLGRVICPVCHGAGLERIYTGQAGLPPVCPCRTCFGKGVAWETDQSPVSSSVLEEMPIVIDRMAKPLAITERLLGFTMLLSKQDGGRLTAFPDAMAVVEIRETLRRAPPMVSRVSKSGTAAGRRICDRLLLTLAQDGYTLRAQFLTPHERRAFQATKPLVL
jgi:hypothetical protein